MGVSKLHMKLPSVGMYFFWGEAWMLVQTWKLDEMPVVKSHIRHLSWGSVWITKAVLTKRQDISLVRKCIYQTGVPSTLHYQ